MRKTEDTIRVELLPGFKFTGKSVKKKWNLPVKSAKPVNGKGVETLKNIFV